MTDFHATGPLGDSAIRFAEALRAWRTPNFNATLVREIERLDADLLPLQQALTRSSYVAPRRPSAMILGIAEESDRIQATVGIFFAGIIAGCSCADDPTPVDEIDEYCEVRFDIDKHTAAVTVTLL
jgi:hypothetical protein